MWKKMKSIDPFFLGKKIKLTKYEGGVVYGKITKITDGCIIFETKRAVSLLGIRFIREISLADKESLRNYPVVEIKYKKPDEKNVVSPREVLTQVTSNQISETRNIVTKRRRSNDFSYSTWWAKENIDIKEVEK